MPVDVRKVLREKPGVFARYFITLLVLAEDNAELIDVVTLFGLDRLAEVIERLGGSRVVFPTWETIDSLVRDAYLLARFESLIDTPEERKKLLEEFEGMTFSSLRARAKALRAKLDRGISSEKFPGEREAKRWLNNLEKAHKEIQNGGRE